MISHNFLQTVPINVILITINVKFISIVPESRAAAARQNWYFYYFDVKWVDVDDTCPKKFLVLVFNNKALCLVSAPGWADNSISRLSMYQVALS